MRGLPADSLRATARKMLSGNVLLLNDVTCPAGGRLPSGVLWRQRNGLVVPRDGIALTDAKPGTCASIAFRGMARRDCALTSTTRSLTRSEIRPARGRLAGLAIVALSVLAIAVVTLTPADPGPRLPVFCLRCGARWGVDLLLNVVMFVPLGFGLTLFGVPRRRVLLLLLAATVAIESLQFLAIPGRYASVRDIVVNSVGGAIGIWLASGTLLRPSARRATALWLTAAFLWVATQVATAWALQPLAPASPWWAQMGHDDRGYPARFAGDFVRVSVGPLPVPYNDRIGDTEAVRAALLHGASLEATVTSVRPTPAPAPIVMLALPAAVSEVAVLGQDGADGFFRMRTNAVRAGLHNPAIRLSSAFAESGGRDTVVLSGRYRDGRYTMHAVRADTARERTVAASPSWGWALLVPVRHYVFGAEMRWATAAWLTLALGLVGFWIIPAEPRSPGRRAVLLGVVIVSGLAIVPLAWGLHVAHWSEWLAAGGGAAAGMRGAHLVGDRSYRRWRRDGASSHGRLDDLGAHD